MPGIWGFSVKYPLLQTHEQCPHLFITQALLTTHTYKATVNAFPGVSTQYTHTRRAGRVRRARNKTNQDHISIYFSTKPPHRRLAPQVSYLPCLVGYGVQRYALPSLSLSFFRYYCLEARANINTRMCPARRVCGVYARRAHLNDWCLPSWHGMLQI